MDIRNFSWNGWDDNTTYSAGVVILCLINPPHVLLVRQKEGTVREQADGTKYREQSWWKCPFGKRVPEEEYAGDEEDSIVCDTDILETSLRETEEESGRILSRGSISAVVSCRMSGKRKTMTPKDWHEDYFFLAPFDIENLPKRAHNGRDSRVAETAYFPLNRLPIVGDERDDYYNANGVTIARRHLWAIYSLCMERTDTRDFVSPYERQVGR